MHAIVYCYLFILAWLQHVDKLLKETYNKFDYKQHQIAVYTCIEGQSSASVASFMLLSFESLSTYVCVFKVNTASWSAILNF